MFARLKAAKEPKDRMHLIPVMEWILHPMDRMDLAEFPQKRLHLRLFPSQLFRIRHIQVLTSPAAVRYRAQGTPPPALAFAHVLTFTLTLIFAPAFTFAPVLVLALSLALTFAPILTFPLAPNVIRNAFQKMFPASSPGSLPSRQACPGLAARIARITHFSHTEGSLIPICHNFRSLSTSFFRSALLHFPHYPL